MGNTGKGYTTSVHKKLQLNFFIDLNLVL